MVYMYTSNHAVALLRYTNRELVQADVNADMCDEVIVITHVHIIEVH